MEPSHTAKPFAWLSGSITSSNQRAAVRSKLIPIYVCLSTTALALAGDLALGTFATEATDAFYIMAAAASAYSGGWPVGLLSIVLSLLPNIELYNTPHYSLAIGAYGLEHIIVTSVISFALVLLVGRLRQQRTQLRLLNNELEDRVHQRTADLEESNRQLEAFCYTLAHDLRAPLRAIQGFSQIALADNAQQLDTEAQQTLTRIGKSAETMGHLIHDLLVYTQLHRTEIPLASIKLQDVVERVLQILGPEIHDEKATLEIDTPLPCVTANFVLLEQIVLSLVSNALKFTRDDMPPRVRIWSERSDATGIRLVIEDSGTGIPRQYLDRVFEPFHRLNANEKQTGTGMGLAMAKKGIERLNGTIGVDSKLGHGSRFWIQLPSGVNEPASAKH